MKVLYLRLLKNIYGFMESALLWCYIYATNIKSQEFVVNPYYRCIANSAIGGKQCAVSWLADDNKLSHFDEYLNKRIIEMMAEHFGKIAVLRGGKHNFLEMDK